MSLLDQPLGSITIVELERLIANGVLEGRTLEYKRDAPAGTDEGKREFLADVSSLANASGGDILFGVSEQNAVAFELVGIANEDIDDLRLRLGSMARDGIQPRIPSLAFHPVTVGEGRSVLILRVRASLAAPHMVVFRNTSRFWSRTSAGKYQLDVFELRRSFLSRETALDRARQFRVERVGRLIGGELPTAMGASPKVVVHVVPLTISDEMGVVDLHAMKRQGTPIPMDSESTDSRFIYEGLLFIDRQDGSSSTTYALAFRSGAFEGVCTSIIHSSQNNGDDVFSSVRVEGQVSMFVDHVRSLYREVGVTPPFAIGVTLLDVRGRRIVPRQDGNRRLMLRDPLKQEDLVLPEVIIEEEASRSVSELRPAFDVMWQAGGWERSLNYDRGEPWADDAP